MQLNYSAAQRCTCRLWRDSSMQQADSTLLQPQHAGQSSHCMHGKPQLNQPCKVRQRLRIPTTDSRSGCIEPAPPVLLK